MSRTHGQLQQYNLTTQFRSQLFDNSSMIGSCSIHFVNKSYSGYTVAAHLPIDCERLALHAPNATQDQDSAIEHAQAALDFDSEVDVARRIDDLQNMIGPIDAGDRRLNRDATFLFDRITIHGRADTVATAHFMNLMNTSTIKQNPLSQRGLTRVNVSRDTDVSKSFKASHRMSSFNIYA